MVRALGIGEGAPGSAEETLAALAMVKVDPESSRNGTGWKLVPGAEAVAPLHLEACGPEWGFPALNLSQAVRLTEFVLLNVEALRKIVKKMDKTRPQSCGDHSDGWSVLVQTSQDVRDNVSEGPAQSSIPSALGQKWAPMVTLSDKGFGLMLAHIHGLRHFGTSGRMAPALAALAALALRAQSFVEHSLKQSPLATKSSEPFNGAGLPRFPKSDGMGQNSIRKKGKNTKNTKARFWPMFFHLPGRLFLTHSQAGKLPSIAEADAEDVKMPMANHRQHWDHTSDTFMSFSRFVSSLCECIGVDQACGRVVNDSRLSQRKR